MTNTEYILANKEEDIRSLALRKVPEGVNASWCLTQIEGYQLAKKKLSKWTEAEGLIYPPRLSMEQCSSELTAEYKAGIVKRLLGKYQLKHLPLGEEGRGPLIDLTGGFGVDFSYMAKECEKAIYVEKQEVLCDAARNNFPLLGLNHAEVWNMDAEEALNRIEHVSLINIDPARRDNIGRKVAAIEDCTPNLVEIQDKLLEKADNVLVKLSPMLDIAQALRTLHHVIEVHVVSVKNECKELLFVASKNQQSINYNCINLGTREESFITTTKEGNITFTMPEVGMLLVEPNSSIMKAGMQDAFAQKYGLKKLHPMSHLYVASPPALPRREGACAFANGTKVEIPHGIPGRVFRIKDIGNVKKIGVKQANLAIRNFPSTVAELRKRLKIKEGGDEYLFATTLMDTSTTLSTSKHVIIRCEKLVNC